MLAPAFGACTAQTLPFRAIGPQLAKYRCERACIARRNHQTGAPVLHDKSDARSRNRARDDGQARTHRLE